MDYTMKYNHLTQQTYYISNALERAKGVFWYSKGNGKLSLCNLVVTRMELKYSSSCRQLDGESDVST